MRILGIALALSIAGCASIPVTVLTPLPPNSQVAVIMFRNCTIAGQDDCAESGISAGTVFAHAFSERPGITAVPLSRPVPSSEPLDDSAAVAYAKGKGYQFVINGDVEDYYRVAPMTFRAERAGVSVRLLRVSDGTVMAYFSKRGEAPNLSTPDAILKGMADKFRDSVFKPQT